VEIKTDEHVKGKSIAVLPFTNMSSDPDQEYFSDGITEDIIAQISKINELKVISRTSVIQYKKSQKSIPEIRSALKVSYLLEGSVRKAGNRLRIVAQLIDTIHDKHLWAETFDRDLTDIFEIQTEIAEKIANKIKGHLTEAEHIRLNEKPTGNMEAYNLYLLGKYHYNKATPEDRNLATNYLERAINLDPGFALAYATLAAVIMFQGVGYFGIRPHDVMPEAFKMANKAIQLDPGLSYAYLVRGEIYDWYFFEWDKANYDYRKAIALNPNNADAHLYYAVHLAAHRKFDEAIQEKDIASDLDPYSVMIRMDGFWIMHVGGQTEKAFQEVYPGFILENDKIYAGFCKAMYLTAMGKTEESVIAWRETFEASKGSLAETFFKIFFAYGLARSGNHEESKQILTEIHDLEKKEFIWPMGIAFIYAHLGESAKALDYLEKSYEERTGWMLWIGCDPALDVLRKEPRFKNLVRKIGPPEAIAEIDRFG
jgi:TolB-like protein